MQTTFFSLPPEFTEPLRTGSRLRLSISTMKAIILLTMLVLPAPLVADRGNPKINCGKFETLTTGCGAEQAKCQLSADAEAMKQEVAKLGEEYPQLGGAGAVEVKPGKWLFKHDCRHMGKRGYENAGPFPVAIGLRLMTTERFREQVEKRAGNDHRPVDLADAAAKLTAAVGGEWRVVKRESVHGLGQELWCSFSSWHGVHVPYVIVPFPSSDDAGRVKLNAFSRECSAALEVIASDDRWTLVAGPSHEPEVTGNVLLVLGMKMSKDAEARRRANARAEWLDFRLAVATDDNPPSAAQIANCRDLFARKGPNGGRHRGDPYLWFSKMDICDAPTAVVRTRDEHGAEYLLLGDKPEDVLISGSARPRPWYLKRVHASKDAHGRTSITLELDETSARRIRELIRDKKGRPLAVLFHDSILAIQTIDEGSGDRIVIGGDDKGFDEKLAGKIVRSLSECMLPGSLGRGEEDRDQAPGRWRRDAR